MLIIPRSAWGATNATNPGGTTVALSRRTEFFVHYSLGEELGRPDTHAWVKEIQRFHMGPQRKWADIGYNFLVDMYGNVFEGRGWNKAGAHCPDHNTTGIGVCFLGDDDAGVEDATPAARRAMRELYDEACRKTGRALAKKGHRDGKATTCPGDELYGWVRAGMPLPAAPSQPVAPRPPAPPVVERTTMPVPQTVRKGDKGDGVRRMQALLIAAFHDLSQEGGIDGIFGAGGERELKSFQAHRGIPADGVCGERTWHWLLHGRA